MSMSNENTSDRLDKMEALLKLTIEGLAETRQLTESNARSIAETKQLTESNGKAIQAMLDQRATDQLKHDQYIRQQQEINSRLAKYIDGLGKMMSKIDEERPTVLRKLTTIENKLDSLSTIETKLDRIIEEK